MDFIRSSTNEHITNKQLFVNEVKGWCVVCVEYYKSCRVICGYDALKFLFFFESAQDMKWGFDGVIISI